MPASDNATSRLIDVTDTLQEQYWPTFQEQIFRKGQSTNRIIPFAEKGEFEVVGDGVNIQVESGLSDTARMSTDPNSDFPTPRSFIADLIKVRFSESTTSSNDFATINTSAKVTHHEMEADGDGAIIDVAEKVFKDVTRDFNQKLAMFRNVPRSGLLALVNGAPVENDAITYAGGASTADNTDGIRAKVDNGTIAIFDAGMHVDFWDPTNTDYPARNIEITDANTSPDDFSFGGKFNSTGADQSTGNLADVADNDEIYLSGGKGSGMYSLEEWFNRPSSGDSFIGGLDRTSTDARWLLPVSTREGSSSAQILPSHLDDLGDAMNFVTDEEDMGVVAYGDTRLVSSLRQRLDANSIVQLPPKSNGKRDFTFGAMGVKFQHPAFGMVTLLANTFAKPGTLRLLVPEDWRSLNWGWRDLMFLPGDAGISPWYRPQNDAGTGRSKFYRLDAFSHFCDVCLKPRRQGQILNVTA